MDVDKKSAKIVEVKTEGKEKGIKKEDNGKGKKRYFPMRSLILISVRTLKTLSTGFWRFLGDFGLCASSKLANCILVIF